MHSTHGGIVIDCLFVFLLSFLNPKILEGLTAPRIPWLLRLCNLYNWRTIYVVIFWLNWWKIKSLSLILTWKIILQKCHSCKLYCIQKPYLDIWVGPKPAHRHNHCHFCSYLAWYIGHTKDWYIAKPRPKFAIAIETHQKPLVWLYSS